MSGTLQNYPGFTGIAPMKGGGLGFVEARVPEYVADQMANRFETGGANYGAAEFDVYSTEGPLVIVQARVRRAVVDDFYAIYLECCPRPQ